MDCDTKERGEETGRYKTKPCLSGGGQDQEWNVVEEKLSPLDFWAEARGSNAGTFGLQHGRMDGWMDGWIGLGLRLVHPSSSPAVPPECKREGSGWGPEPCYMATDADCIYPTSWRGRSGPNVTARLAGSPVQSSPAGRSVSQ